MTEPNETIHHLQQRLEASQLRNVEYQIKLGKAAEENEEGREEIKGLIKGYQQAKVDMAETISRLESFKACMELEGARYYQSDEKLMATELVENNTSKEELANTEDYVYSLKDIYMDGCAYSHDSSTDECAYSQGSFTDQCIYCLDRDERAAALQDQVYSWYEFIGSLRRKVFQLEDNLETCESKRRCCKCNWIDCLGKIWRKL
uniref:AlNc14C53G4111 protein n=1 Tax=Albugo laibachii Nc14 TaxID=890382 RepID=F0WBS0_9STRA|nr:AlNc14C53G4111 [Albugo laibachii Nc14]CCA20554.1 AlNc14C97G5914 [Albugo laibachii Nc14]|eukprot:CCA20554.1 AlNc14C97G5914 [Albugo laibachii Nc14]